MRIRSLKLALVLSCGLVAVSARAATAEKPAPKPFADADHVTYIPLHSDSRALLKTILLVVNHGGGVIASPKVTFLFWGPSFNNAASPDYVYARTLQAYRDQFGSSAAWSVLGEYRVMVPTNLGGGPLDWFDTSTPPTNVTDSTVRAEINRYFSGGHGTYNSSTIYEVVTPKTSYSSSGSSTSCNGPSLAYCAYQGSFSGTSGTVFYSIQPYASCTGCQVSGWSDVQNQEHLVFAETCDAATHGWYDSSGKGVCDKCTWSPPPFLVDGYGYQYVWSNLARACVNSR